MPIINLPELIANPGNAFPAHQPLAFDANSELSWGQFSLRISAWETVFTPLKSQIVALYLRDSVEFAAALVALWRQGKQALIPANNLPDTLSRAAKLTSDFAGDFDLPHRLQPDSEVEPRELARLAPVTLPQAALTLYTSGSSGAPVAINKSFAQLNTELRALDTLWGAQLAGARIATSVSHHHIYGLLFRLLWPLCAGRCFSRYECDYWEELAQLAGTGKPLAIISSPAHLGRIPPLDWPLNAQLTAVFSSGAPLRREASLEVLRRLHCPVSEIYGSTETGGIAWREQDKDDIWRCLPGVEVRLAEADGLLQVRSPHLADAEWFTSADAARLVGEGQFELCGRADRIVKVGGKRISLTAIEQILERHPLVAQVRLLLLPDRGERLGAVLVLNNAGNKQLVDQGKLALNQIFKQALDGLCDRVAIPRYWRYMAQLPCNRQGKTTLDDLQALFTDAELPRLPELLERTAETNTLSLKLFVPANLYYFDGHFPGRPVLPGVVQTHWAVHYARQHWGDLGEFGALEVLKFQQVICANQSLALSLEYQSEKNKLYFAYTSGPDSAPVAHASGRVAFTRRVN